MNAVSFMCSSWMFARGSNRLLEAVGAKSLNEVYVYDLLRGSGDLVRAIDSIAIPSMRIARSACLNLIAQAQCLVGPVPDAYVEPASRCYVLATEGRPENSVPATAPVRDRLFFRRVALSAPAPHIRKGRRAICLKMAGVGRLCRRTRRPARAVIANTARLRALRLARDAALKAVPAQPAAARSGKKRST
jgi:hypothetical protein